MLSFLFFLCSLINIWIASNDGVHILIRILNLFPIKMNQGAISFKVFARLYWKAE